MASMCDIPEEKLHVIKKEKQTKTVQHGETWLKVSPPTVQDSCKSSKSCTMLRCVGSGAGLTDESRKRATRDVETELTR